MTTKPGDALLDGLERRLGTLLRRGVVSPALLGDLASLYFISQKIVLILELLRDEKQDLSPCDLARHLHTFEAVVADDLSMTLADTLPSLKKLTNAAFLQADTDPEGNLNSK